MAQIIRCTDEVIEKIPTIMQHVYEYFGCAELVIYAVLDNKNLNFIVCNHQNCLYIKNSFNKYEIIPFSLKEDKSLAMIKIDSNYFFYNDDGTIYMVDEQKKEHMIGIKELTCEDEDGYNGFVYYIQYNPSNDTLCDIRYQQMYRQVNGHTPIYSFHTKKIDTLSIDEQYTKKGSDKRGILPPTSKYFTRYEFNHDELGYTLSAIKDYGLFNVITQGAYNLQKDDRVIRYVKTSFVSKDGNYLDLWPFARQINPEQLDELIKSYGFETTIPPRFIEFYNGYNPIASEISSLVTEMIELEKSSDDRKCLIMQLIPDENE